MMMCKHSKYTNESMLSNWDEGFMKIQETVADHLPKLVTETVEGMRVIIVIKPGPARRVDPVAGPVRVC
jgi:hypothetical protein